MRGCEKLTGLPELPQKLVIRAEGSGLSPSDVEAVRRRRRKTGCAVQ